MFSGEVPDDGEKASAENNKKRKLKTPNQVMALENFYNEHKYPTEEMKAKLAEKIGLTEKQVSGWFCHRRIKDKRSVKEDRNTIGSQDRSSVVLRQDSCGSTKQTDYWKPKPREVQSQKLYADGEEDSTSSERSSSLQKNLVSTKGIYVRDVARNDIIQHSRYGLNKPSGYLKVKRETENVAITLVKRQLGRQYRQDGPPLGIEFDPLPPGAFEPQTNVIVQEPIYVGNQIRSHSSYFAGTRKSFNPGPSYELACKSKIDSPYRDSDDDDDDDDNNIVVGMEPGLRDKKSQLKSPPLSFLSSVPNHITNSKKSRLSSKTRAEGARNNQIGNLSGSNTEINQTHDNGNNIFSGGRKSGYLAKSSKLLHLSRSQSPDSIERDLSSEMVANRMRHGYLQQGYAPKSSYSEVLGGESKSDVELASSGEETEEEHSSSMD